MSPALLDETVRWFFAFLFTQAVEVPLYLRVTASWRVAFLASLFTHPIVWFVFPRVWPWAVLGDDSYWGMIIAAEVFAVLAEAAWLHRNHVHRALLWSLVVNGTSTCVGLAFRACFGAP
jgi:hypothetical protein